MRLRDFIRRMDFDALIRFMDDAGIEVNSAGVFGVESADYLEHTLHELSHAATLRMSPKSGGLTLRVEDKVRALTRLTHQVNSTVRDADIWNEALTWAVVMEVARRIGFPIRNARWHAKQQEVPRRMFDRALKDPRVPKWADRVLGWLTKAGVIASPHG